MLFTARYDHESALPALANSEWRSGAPELSCDQQRSRFEETRPTARHEGHVEPLGYFAPRGLYENFWPETEASYIRPPLAMVNTTIPS